VLLGAVLEHGAPLRHREEDDMFKHTIIGAVTLGRCN
jgi:hypothetical protein